MGWIDREAGLPVARQCELSGVARATFYGRQLLREESEGALILMRLIDEEYTRRPFYGSRRMVVSLRRQGHVVNRKRVQRLMRLMGLAGMAPGPSTSVTHPAHQVYPYLLRGLQVCRPNQVWSADISAPCRRGWRKTNHAGWLLTGSWNAAPLGKETERKGAAKLRHVPTAGCHKQSSLNSTGRGPFSTSRATTVSMVRQRNVRRKPLYLAQPTLNDGMAWGDCGAIRLVLMLPTEGCATHIRRWDVL
jgi:hypothetical protein